MKKDLSAIEHLRLTDPNAGNNGYWKFHYKGKDLFVIASDGEGWDHVSVSLRNRCPTWEEMCFVKDSFFDPEETVIQYHPPKSEYVNCHDYCLHMWRPQDVELPLPPGWMVGPIDKVGDV